MTEPIHTEVVIIIRDGLGNSLEVSGLSHPPVFTPTSPAHVVAAYIQANLATIIKCAERDWATKLSIAKQGQDAVDAALATHTFGVPISGLPGQQEPGQALESGEFIPADELNGVAGGAQP